MKGADLDVLFNCGPTFLYKDYFYKSLEKNEYGDKFFDRCLRTSLNKIYSKKVPQHTVTIRIFVFLPYLGKLSLSARLTRKNCL